MSNERWDSPFAHTLAFLLFKKHFAELNDAYWAHVPAANTIEKAALRALGNVGADPKEYFLIPDEDDRRIAPTYEKWKENYREFSNYTRLNTLMLLSSCFETYLRTVASIAFESKPGVIIGCPDAVDGVFLLKSRPGYGIYCDKSYQFADAIDEVCRGEWSKRFSAFHKYFGAFPDSILDNAQKLDDLRQKRNNVGHYFGRPKNAYETPIFFMPEPIQRVSHYKLLDYFKLIYCVAKEIDLYLQQNFIGSYDIIKYYFQNLENGTFADDRPGSRARELQRIIGAAGIRSASNEYYRNLISYCDLDSANNMCRYSKKACIIAINRKLDDLGLSLVRNNYKVRFSRYHFNVFCNAYSWYTDLEYCVKNLHSQFEYCYSMKLIDAIVSKISENQTTIIEELQIKPKNIGL